MKKRVIYLRMDRTHALQFALLQQALGMTKPALLGEMVNFFVNKRLGPHQATGGSIRKLLSPEMGEEKILLFYNPATLPWPAEAALTYHVRERDLVFSVVVEYLEALDVTLEPTNKNKDLFEQFRTATQRLRSFELASSSEKSNGAKKNEPC